jgi:hypothetical protein
MRNNYLSDADLAIWMTAIARRIPRRLPFFATYIFASIAESVVLLVICLWGSYPVYYYAFFYTGHIISILAFLTLIELARQVLPGLDLPGKQTAGLSLGAGLAVVAVFVWFWPFRFIEKRIEVGLYLAIAVAFAFVTVYARFLKLRWSRLVGGVALTLGIVYLVRGIAKTVIGFYPPEVVLAVRQASEITNVIACIVWTIVVLSPWGEYKMTEEDLLKFQEIVGAAQANVRRFIAGGSQ